MLPWGVPPRKAERKQNAWKSLNAWKSPNSWASVRRFTADLQFVAGFANSAETMKLKLQRLHPTRKIPLTGAELKQLRKDLSDAIGRPLSAALRPTKISASDPPSTWWPGER
jgi:hypothetical protein